MTAICGGGTSSPKFGTAATVDYSAGLLAAIFAAYDLAWLIPVIPLVGLAPLVLTSFCSSDPPAIPTFTSAETNALLQAQLGADFDSGLGKLRDLILNTIWYDACQCNSGSLTPLAPPTPPSGTPITQPPRASVGTACTTSASATYCSFAATADQRENPVNPASGNYTNFHWGRYSATLATPSPLLNVTSLRFNTRRTQVGAGPHEQVTWQIHWQGWNAASSSNVFIADQFFSHAADGVVHVFDTAVPDGATNFEMEYVAAHVSTDTLWLHIEAFCNGDTPGAQTPCCPPDVSTQAYLDQILGLVKLIQRQHVPFSTIGGTTHAGLSGNGHVSVSSLVGMRIVISSLPGHVGEVSGDPTEYFDAGWVNWCNADGCTLRERIMVSPQLSIPANAQLYTSFHWSLPPNVTIDISEIEREP